MKKWMRSLFTTVLLSMAMATVAFAADAVVDSANVAKGVITVTYTGASNGSIKALVEKGSDKYQYNLSKNTPTNLPLNMGAGEYTVSVMEQVAGNNYRRVISEKVNAAALDEKAVYLNSVQNVNFNKNMIAIKELNQLLSGITNNEEKVKVIYNYIITHVSYDFDKAAVVVNATSYLPVIDETYSKELGICYDYAALFASVLRDNGIPSKLQMGYSADIQEFHAWNEIFLGDKWVKIDTTYDAQAQKVNVDYSMIKDNSRFQVTKQY